MFRSAPQRSPDRVAQLFLSMPLEKARSTAARAATASLAEGRHEFDLDDEDGLRRLGEALSEAVGAGTGDVSALLSAVLGTASMLRHVEWHAAGADRPEKPALPRQTLEGALLIHLHGTPDGLPARILQQEYADHGVVYPRSHRKSTLAGADRMREYVQAHRERAAALQDYLRTIQS